MPALMPDTHHRQGDGLADLRVGLMGGSFDPVHTAHVQLADTAMTALSLHEVRWVPAGQPWQKMGTVVAGSGPMASAADRLAMVYLATQHNPRFVVDTLEIDRAGPSYTLDTLHALQKAHPQVSTWYLIIGQDQYARFHTWHEWQRILQMVTLAVACRGNAQPAPPDPLRHVPHRWVSLPMPPSSVSSTEIRRQLASGTPAISLVPTLLDAAVARYIEHHQLYAPRDPL